LIRVKYVLRITLKGLPSEVAKRMAFEEQLIRTTWIKGSTTPKHTFLVPSKGSLPKSRDVIPLRGEGYNTPGVTMALTP
jgi:hypothetical protein